MIKTTGVVSAQSAKSNHEPDIWDLEALPASTSGFFINSQRLKNSMFPVF